MARRSSTARAHAEHASGTRRVSQRTSSGTKTVERPIGRPTKLTENTESVIVGYLTEGMSIDATCALAGINQATFHRWMQRGEDARDTLDSTGSLPPEEEIFRDFRERVLDARAQAEYRAVGIINKAMHGGFVTSEEPAYDLNGNPIYDEDGKLVYKRTMTPPDGRLALAYLQRARPKDWSIAGANLNAKVEISGPGGGPVEVEHTVEMVSNLRDRILAVRDEFEREEAEMQEIEAGSGEAADIVDADIVEDREQP